MPRNKTHKCLPAPRREKIGSDHRRMDAGFRGWIYNTARKNYWRVAASCELDDLIQEGYWIYYHVVRRYPHVRDRAHLMRLVQISYVTRIHDLARRDKRPEVAFDDLPPVVVNSMGYGPQTLMGDAPPFVRLALYALMTADGRTLRAEPRERIRGRRETFNERLCRMTGLDPKIVDLPAEIKKFLRGQDEPVRIRV